VGVLLRQQLRQVQGGPLALIMVVVVGLLVVVVLAAAKQLLLLLLLLLGVVLGVGPQADGGQLGCPSCSSICCLFSRTCCCGVQPL
jgi:hypothetical protein